MNRLANHVIIVTGSTTGIGKAIALRCLEHGARVVFHGLESDLAEQVQVELSQKFPDPTRWAFCVADLNQEASIQELVDVAVRHFSTVTGVVNNAAFIPFSNIQTTDSDLFMQTWRINTLAPFLLIQAALPYLQKEAGSVVNIGSVNNYCGEPNLLPYSISKGGLTTLTRNLGDALMQQCGVRVNQVNPGWVLTENEQKRKREHGLSDDWESQLPRVFAPAGRILRPQEIAATVVLLLSGEAGPISGQVWDLEQYPMIGRNPPKDQSTIAAK